MYIQNVLGVVNLPESRLNKWHNQEFILSIYVTEKSRLFHERCINVKDTNNESKMWPTKIIKIFVLSKYSIFILNLHILYY